MIYVLTRLHHRITGMPRHFLNLSPSQTSPTIMSVSIATRERGCRADTVLVISNPMDLQTMLKKVKQKQYKSKRDFKDDLDLIWSNCFTYNQQEVGSPLACALMSTNCL